MDFQGEAKVHCWGELVSYRGRKTKHAESKTFLKSAVTVSEEPKDYALMDALFEQGIARRRAAGWGIFYRWINARRSGWVIDYRPGQVNTVARALRAAEWAEEIGDEDMTDHWLNLAAELE
jgi:hypothetical protein